MTPLIFFFLVLLISYSAGLLGSLVGVGGGIIVVPALTLIFGIDIHNAIAASIVAVVATSTGAASTYVRDKVANMRLGMLLEVATVAGALGGALLAAYVSPKALYILFALLMAYTAGNMSQKRKAANRELPPSPLADRLNLHGAYYDKALKQEVGYRVTRPVLGFAVSGLAGLASGLLGIGGGVLKVPVMNLFMGIPIKACTATSNFMIGVTAASGAAVYFMRGDVQPFVVAPVAIGVLFGAKTGAQVMNHIHGNVLRIIFVIILSLTAIQMFVKGIK
ncbi:MAG: sulfite exporter TauE/SafE family protein [Verrucomicrobiales bacterium]|jgi:uncharacterized membrane protein YfcA|nr:sulfite exporter TauE/SafE family protein [Verrucomicrobiales bacterium]